MREREAGDEVSWRRGGSKLSEEQRGSGNAAMEIKVVVDGGGDYL